MLGLYFCKISETIIISFQFFSKRKVCTNLGDVHKISTHQPLWRPLYPFLLWQPFNSPKYSFWSEIHKICKIFVFFYICGFGGLRWLLFAQKLLIFWDLVKWSTFMKFWTSHINIPKTSNWTKKCLGVLFVFFCWNRHFV